MKTIQSACPLDCWDACSVLVNLEDDHQVSLAGDPSDPITQGFLCSKGQKMLERFRHPDRLTAPMKRNGDNWEVISWEEALEGIANKLKTILSTHGSTSLIHYSEGGHGGLAKNIDTAFFNALGGATRPRGSLCWGAGIAAQKLDFGNAYCHPPQDLENTKCFILWGRNPAATNVHLVPFIKGVRRAGFPVYLIDPVNSASASLADHHLALKPGSDGHLALALAKYIVEKGYMATCIENHSQNLTEYLALLDRFSFDELIAPTGLSEQQVFQLAETYGTAKPGTIYLGYGMQRSRWGGRNIRFIDALAVLAGNIGVAGGGVNYAHRHASRWVDGEYLENDTGRQSPTFPRATFASYVLSQPKGNVQGLFVSKANPAVQLPDTNQVLEALQSIPFKVVIDHFMTDTARLADYVLPPTMILEEEDIVFSSMWHNRFTWTEKALEPPVGVMHEFDMFYGLAQRLNLNDFTRRYPNIPHYLATSVAPLCDYLRLTPAEMRGRRLSVPGQELPWKDKVFETSTDLFHFCTPVPEELIPPEEETPDGMFPLVTVHRSESLHSQHMRTLPEDQLPLVQMNPSTGEAAGVQPGDTIRLVSSTGSLACSVSLDPAIQTSLLVLQQGTWLKNGGVNQLTAQTQSDIGEQVAYHQCYCRIEKSSE